MAKPLDLKAHDGASRLREDYDRLLSNLEEESTPHNDSLQIQQLAFKHIESCTCALMATRNTEIVRRNTVLRSGCSCKKRTAVGARDGERVSSKAGAEFG
jgi:hypothetical protein